MSTLHRLYNQFRLSGSISIDSRTCEEGQIFFAIKGDRFDGHEYLQAALDKGASLGVIDNPKYTGEKTFLVNDTLQALQDLSRLHRLRHSIPVIALTGSNGKTTTKELIASVLSIRFNTWSTRGNLNNHIGVPLTLLKIGREHEMVIVEMGANHVGEIRALCQIAEPTHGLITNIGKAHIGEFGGQDKILEGKCELFDFVSQRQQIFFHNVQDPLLTTRIGNYPYAIRYGHSKIQGLHFSDISVEVLEYTDFIHLRLVQDQSDYTLRSPLYGPHNIQNIMAAIAVGAQMDLSLTEIIAGIERYVPDNNRSQKIPLNDHVMLWADAYNANPNSMEAAILSFAQSNHAHRSIVLADMLELGEHSKEEHQAVLGLLSEFSWHRVILIGPEFGRVGKNYEWYPTTQDMIATYPNGFDVGSAVLIKGSRSLQLEKLVPVFQSYYQ